MSMMKHTTTYLTAVLVASLFAACSDDAKRAKEAARIEAELQDVQAKIDELKQNLEKASAEKKHDIETQLDEAQAQQKQLSDTLHDVLSEVEEEREAAESEDDAGDDGDDGAGDEDDGGEPESDGSETNETDDTDPEEEQ